MLKRKQWTRQKGKKKKQGIKNVSEGARNRERGTEAERERERQRERERESRERQRDRERQRERDRENLKKSRGNYLKRGRKPLETNGAV